MAQLQWVVFCRKAVVDSSDNNISLHSILSEIHPLVPKDLDLQAGDGTSLVSFESNVAASFLRSDRAVAENPEELLLKLINPEGKAVANASHTLDLSKNSQSRLILQIPGVPISPEGVYSWQVFLKKKNRWAKVGSTEYLLGHVRSDPDLAKLQVQAQKNAGGMKYTRSKVFEKE